MLAACSVFEELPECPVEDTEDFLVSFKMVTSAHLTRTRTDSSGHDEVESEYREFEDGLNISDLGIFIFVKKPSADGNDTFTEELLLKSTDLSSSNQQMDLVGSPGAYTVNMTIRKTQLSDLLGWEINPEGAEDITFRILILANCSSPGTNAQAKWNEINGTNYKEVINQLETWRFAMSYIYNSEEEGDEAVKLYNKGKKNIPMFGTNQFTVTQESLYYSRYESRVHLGKIDMLRALAKVRVVDNIRNKDAGGYPKIVGASFTGSQDQVCQLPKDAAGYTNGTQVHSPNIAYPDNTLSLETPHTFKMGVIPDAWTNIAANARKGDVRIGYVPEQKIGYINNNAATGAMPFFHIKVELSDHTFKEYDVDMKSFNNQTFEFGENILRNHIYTLSVNEVKELEVDLTVEIVAWTKETLTLQYTEIPDVTQKLSWDSYESYDEDTGVVVVKPASSVESIVPLKGRFKLGAPEGATLHAFLIPSTGNGNPYAFQFKDEKGNYTSSLSGTVVPGKEIEIEIYPRIVEPEENNEVSLQIVVTLGNGNVIEVPVTPDGKTYKNFTILQNKQ